MTSTNDGKDVKSNQISGKKDKTYYIEVYKSLESRLTADSGLQERTPHLCEAWRRIHSLCQHSAQPTHTHLLSWLQRHTAKTILLTEWQSPSSKHFHTFLEEAINDFIKECQSRDGEQTPWETQLVARGEGFRKMLGNPWGHDVLRVLLDPRGAPPTDEEVLEWLKEERGVVFVTRLRQLAMSKCNDLALSLACFVMDRARATVVCVPDAEQGLDVKEPPKPETPGTFSYILKTEAGFTQDVWELLTDIEFVLLHKGDKRARCIELAKQTPLSNGYQLVDRLQGRLENSPREKKLWKNAKEVARLIAQVVITRCMVVRVCGGVVRAALYWCVRALARDLRLGLQGAAAALAAPAASAAHLHALAAAVKAQMQTNEDMKPFVCELYVRAITAGMNELERLKLKTEKESEARSTEQTLSTWFNQLGCLLSTSERFRCECLLTAFSVHPSPALYERIKAAPALPPVALDIQEPKAEQSTSEFGSWASDSRSQTNFVKTSETLNLKQNKQANILSTAIINEGEALGLSVDLCQDIVVLLSGPRVKTLTWDMDRELLLENCRAYMERTHFGTRALTTELKYLNIDLRDYSHLPEEEDDEGDIYYGIEKGYEHLIEEYQEPEEIWQDAEEPESTRPPLSSESEDEVITKTNRSHKKKNRTVSDEEKDPLSLPEEKKKERPHSKERSRHSSKSRLKEVDPLDIQDLDKVENILVTMTEKVTMGTEKVPKEKKPRARKEKKDKVPKEKKEKVPKEKKEKVPRVKKEKVPKEKKEKFKKIPSVSSLSDLIGLKVNNRPMPSTPIHSQNKYSSNMLSPEAKNGDVLFDGLFSMDEMKSPENSLNTTMGRTNEITPPNRLDLKPSIGSNYYSNVQKAASLVSSYPPAKKQPNNIWTDVWRSENENHNHLGRPRTIRNDVRTSLSKLLRFRATKNNKFHSNPTSKSNVYPSTSAQTLVHQSQNNHLASSEGCMPSSYSKLNNTNLLETPRPPLKLPSPIKNDLKSGNNTAPVKLPRATSPRKLDSFFSELRETINAGPNINTMKLESPKTVAPELHFQKPHISPPSAKPTLQTKSDNAPNTFSRLSYLHKNKNELDLKQQKVIGAIIEHQKQAMQNQVKVDELNKLIMEQKKLKSNSMQMKYNRKPINKKTLSNVETQKTTPKTKNTTRKAKNTVTKTSPNQSTMVKNHPLISNTLLAGPMISQNLKHTTPVRKPSEFASSTTLTEKDQHDLVLLLRQKNKQDLNHYWPKVTESSVNTINTVQDTYQSATSKNMHSTQMYENNKTSVPYPSAQYQNVFVNNSQAKPAYVKTDTKHKNRTETQAQLNQKSLENQQTDWESVMDTILSLKTPNRDGIAHLNSQQVDQSPLDSNLMKQKQSKSSSHQLKNIEHLSPANTSVKKGNRKGTVINSQEKPDLLKPAINSNYVQKSCKAPKQELLRKSLETEIMTTPVTKNTVALGGPETLDILKGHNTCPLSSRQDPFISGLPNTDYDLLEEFELMDDELRQEIGELSSDEESFVSKGIPNPANKLAHPVQETKRAGYPPLNTTQTTAVKKAAPKIKVESIKITRPADPLPKQTRLINTQLGNVGYKTIQDTTPMIPAPNVIHQLPKNIIISTKNGNQTLLVNPEPTRIIEPTTILTTPQPTSLQNVVLIGSDIVYQPCAVQTPIQAPIHLAQNAFLAVNTTPNVALYQTTQFAAPVINPVFIGNALTNTSTMTAPSIPATNVNPIPTELPDMKPSANNPEVIQNKTLLNHDTVDDVSDICDAYLNITAAENSLKQTKDSIEINSSKNCERKVLSEVQERLVVESQRISAEPDSKKDTKTDKERLHQKRMAILNRTISHKIQKKPIPLSYTPLLPKETESESEMDSAIMKLKSLINCKAISLKQISTNNEESKNKVINKETSKENKSDTSVRRILLRSSNNQANRNNSSERADAGEILTTDTKKAKVRLKPTSNKSTTIKTPENNNSKAIKTTKKKQTRSLLKINNDFKAINVKETEVNVDKKSQDFSEFMDLEEQIVGCKIPKVSPTVLKSDDSSDQINMEDLVDANNTVSQTINLNCDEEINEIDLDQSDIITCVPPSEMTESKVNSVVEQRTAHLDATNEDENNSHSIDKTFCETQKDSSSNINDHSDIIKNSEPDQTNDLDELTTESLVQNGESSVSLTAPDNQITPNIPEPISVQSNSEIVNCLQEDARPVPNLENSVPEIKKPETATDSEVICLDDGDDLPSVSMNAPVQFKTSNEKILANLNNIVTPESVSPDQIKDAIKIENLSYPGPIDPLMKVVRITLPTGKVFKATIRGHVTVDIDALFADPALKAVIMNNVSKTQRYSLNVNHPVKPDSAKNVEKPVKVINKTKNVETIDLLSDSDDESPPQVFSTKYGNYKVKPMDQKTFGMHQNCFKKRCVVTFRKSDIVQETKKNEVDICKTDTTSTEEVDSAILQNNIDNVIDGILEEADTLPKVSEIIELDDTSSSDESAAPSNNTSSQKFIPEEPKEKINVFKKLLLNDFGIQDDIVDKSEICQITETAPESSDKDCSISAAEGITKPLEENMSDTNVNTNNSEGTSTDFSHTSVSTSTPDVSLNCFIKLSNCDDLVKTYVELKTMKKCVIKLVRCDDPSQDKMTSIENVNTPLDFIDESIDITEHVPLSRSGSFSILNDYSILEDQDKSDYRANSPVMDAYESIVSSSLLQAYRLKRKEEIPKASGKNICHSDWLYTKRDIYTQGKHSVISDDYNCTEDDSDETTSAYSDYSVDDVNICDLIFTKTSRVPSLKRLLVNYVNSDCSLECLFARQVKVANLHETLVDETSMDTSVKNLKRKSSETFDNNNKIPRNDTNIDNGMIQTESGPENSIPEVKHAIENNEMISEIITLSNLDNTIETTSIRSEINTQTEESLVADKDSIELDVDSCKIDNVSESNSISILCETHDSDTSSIDNISETNSVSLLCESQDLDVDLSSELKVDIIDSNVSGELTLLSENQETILADDTAPISIIEFNSSQIQDMIKDSDICLSPNIDEKMNVVENENSVNHFDHVYTSRIQGYCNEIEVRKDDDEGSPPSPQEESLQHHIISPNVSITEEIVEMHSDEIIDDSLVNCGALDALSSEKEHILPVSTEEETTSKCQEIASEPTSTISSPINTPDNSMTADNEDLDLPQELIKQDQENLLQTNSLSFDTPTSESRNTADDSMTADNDDLDLPQELIKEDQENLIQTSLNCATPTSESGNSADDSVTADNEDLDLPQELIKEDLENLIQTNNLESRNTVDDSMTADRDDLDEAQELIKEDQENLIQTNDLKSRNTACTSMTADNVVLDLPQEFVKENQEHLIQTSFSCATPTSVSRHPADDYMAADNEAIELIKEDPDNIIQTSLSYATPFESRNTTQMLEVSSEDDSVSSQSDSQDEEQPVITDESYSNDTTDVSENYKETVNNTTPTNLIILQDESNLTIKDVINEIHENYSESSEEVETRENSTQTIIISKCLKRFGEKHNKNVAEIDTENPTSETCNNENKLPSQIPSVPNNIHETETLTDKSGVEVKAIPLNNIMTIEDKDVDMRPVILLEGIEVTDPELGKYVYILPGKRKIPKTLMNNEERNINQAVEDNDIETKDIKLKIPKKTYSTIINLEELDTSKGGRTLKRKSDMMDVKVIQKKYRKGKNIDYPKLTITSIRETAYTQEFRRLFDYCSSVKFSYSRPFHIEYIDVLTTLRNWPIKGSLEIEELKVENHENIFKDLDGNDATIQDPLDQTLVEELTTDYTESNYFLSNASETNFSMGFGEESGRVIQNLEGEPDLKFSAATLSDVKQFQPHLHCDNNQDVHVNTYNNQLQFIDRQMKCIQLKNIVREYFKQSMIDLNENSGKKNQKGVLEDNCALDLQCKYLLSPQFIVPAPFQTVVNVVQVGQLPVSAAAQNPMTCDPRVTQVSNASPSQCAAENSPNDDPHSAIKTEYTELTTADFSMPLGQNYAQHIIQSIPEESNMNMGDMPIDDMRPVIKVELEEIPDVKQEVKQEAPDVNEGNESPSLNKMIMQNLEPCDANAVQSSPEANREMLFNSTEKSPQQSPEAFPPQKYLNGSSEKIDQIAHAMNAAGITTSSETMTSTRAHALVNILNQKLRQGAVGANQSSANTYPKTTSINAMSLQQALAHILPPPLNQTNMTENHQQSSNNSVAQQVLHIVQSKNASGNQITLVDNSQPSVINSSNSTPVLHIVQNKSATTAGPPSNGTPTSQPNSFGGLSLVDAGLQQGNQLLHIVNTGNQKNANPSQLLKRVNLLTNLANCQGSNEQKMVQFVCKSADGKAIQLNAPHQRSMVLRLQPYDTPNLQATPPKPMEAPDLSPTSNTNNINKDMASQQEIKSRSIYEENYAKFIQNSSSKTTPSEKATSLPKFNQAFGKQVYNQDGSQNKEMSTNNSHMPSTENTECQQTENNINLEHMGQISSPPLLLRKSPAQTTQPQQNLVQQLKQSMAPMNMTMHGGVIYTRQIPVNLGSGQTINLITVPSTELVDDAQKPQGDVKFINQGDIEPSIIKIVPQNNNNTELNEDNNANMGVTNESSQPLPQPVLTQMRIKLPMLSKAPQMVSGARVVRPSFFQIQRNVIGGANQPVYQQLVLTAAPPLGQQTIRLPQTQTRHIKVPSESQSSTESMSSSTLEQLREFDLVLEQVKERSTVQPGSTGAFSKIHASSTDTTDSPTPSGSKPAETTQQVLYSIGNNQNINVAFVNRKNSTAAPTPSTSSFNRSPDSSGINDSPTSSSHVNLPHTVTSEAAASETPAQSRPSKSKSKSRPKASSNPPNTLRLNTVPPKTSSQKPLEDEQTTQRILYILAEYKEQVENSPDKDKPAPRRRTNPPSNPSGSHKRKKCSGRRSGRDMSPINGEDSCRTMGSEDSSCGTSQGDCNESCFDSHSPEGSPRKVVRKLTFENENNPVNQQPRPQPQQRNVIVADGQTITVARGTAGKPATAVLMPANYILPVSMVKGGQQIAIVTNRGPKLLTVSGGDGGATNALLLQRLISPAGLKPMLARPGVRHVRLPTSALHNLHAFNLAASTTIQPPDSTASPAHGPTPPDLVETRANSSPWADRGGHDVKPERGSSPDGSEPWHLPSSADPHDYGYEETVRADNMDRTVLDPIPDRYSPDMEAQRLFDKMFDVDSKKCYMVDSPRCGYDIDASDCDDKAYHQVVHKKDGPTHRQHRLTHVSAAALRHKYAILEHELRLQKSLSEECEDLGVDSPSASELFPEAELLFAASPAHDHTQEHVHHSHTPQPLHSIQPDIDDQIATDQLIRQDRDLGLGLEDVGIVTVSEDGMQATIQLDQEEFARSHPNTTFHSEPTEGEVQPFTISGIKGRQITSTIFHANRTPGTVLMAPTTVISQATENTQPVKYSDIDNMINSLPPANNINLSSVLVKDDGLRFDHILNDTRELHLSNTASAIVHSAGNATQVIRRVCYDNRERDNRFLIDDTDAMVADDAKMLAEDSRDIESMGGDVDDDRSTPERTSLFWDSNSISERSESRRPLDFSSDSEKCCKSPFDETNSTDSSGVGPLMRLDSVIKDARGLERSASADGSSADDTHPPLRTYPAKRYSGQEEERSMSGKTRAGERSPGSPGLPRRASGRGVVKRGCHCCNGSPPRPKKPRQRKPTVDFATAD